MISRKKLTFWRKKSENLEARDNYIGTDPHRHLDITQIKEDLIMEITTIQTTRNLNTTAIFLILKMITLRNSKESLKMRKILKLSKTLYFWVSYNELLQHFDLISHDLEPSYRKKHGKHHSRHTTTPKKSIFKQKHDQEEKSLEKSSLSKPEESFTAKPSISSK